MKDLPWVTHISLWGILAVAVFVGALVIGLFAFFTDKREDDDD